MTGGHDGGQARRSVRWRVVVVLQRTLGAGSLSLGLEVERCGRRASGEDGD